VNSFPHLNAAPLRNEIQRRNGKPIRAVIALLKAEALLKFRTENERKRAKYVTRARKALQRYLKSEL
jgi:hypothetical protein